MRELSLLLDSLVEISKISGRPGDSCGTIAYNTDFLKKKITDTLKAKSGRYKNELILQELLRALNNLVRINSGTAERSHMIYQNAEFVRRKISYQLRMMSPADK